MNSHSLRRVPNPPNPWHSAFVEWLGVPPQEKLEVYEEIARSIISENKSPDVGFRYSVNPYRGCYHGCIYCYARPTHEYLDFGSGIDFSRKIIVKVNAPQLLQKEIHRLSPRRDTLVFSGITDPYQPLEASYRLTEACLRVAGEYGVRVAIITKGTLIRRDGDLLREIHRGSGCMVYISLPFLNREYARVFEPDAPLPSERLNTIEFLSNLGIPTGVALAPIIPGFNDSEIPKILLEARKRGAKRAFMTLLRLPGSVRTIFLDHLKTHYPHRYGRTVEALKRMREGRLYTGEYFKRMSGIGTSWKVLEQLFELYLRRLGYKVENGEHPSHSPESSSFQLPLPLSDAP